MEYEKNRGALDDMFSAAYEELRRLASNLNRNAAATLNPTALVNEAWIRLANSGGTSPESLAHFRAVAARAMRHILIDAARRRHSLKRGGVEDVQVLPLIETVDGLMSWDRDLIALNEKSWSSLSPGRPKSSNTDISAATACRRRPNCWEWLSPRYIATGEWLERG
jgi:DNA-directed RNA polymerase specialized sigma24 family protein